MIIVERSTIPVKYNKASELIEIIHQAKPFYEERNVPFRVYTAYHGQYDVVVLEIEFESLAAEQKFNEEIWVDPFMADLIEKMFELTIRGRTSETWVLHAI